MECLRSNPLIVESVAAAKARGEGEGKTIRVFIGGILGRDSVAKARPTQGSHMWTTESVVTTSLHRSLKPQPRTDLR